LTARRAYYRTRLFNKLISANAEKPNWLFPLQIGCALVVLVALSTLLVQVCVPLPDSLSALPDWSTEQQGLNNGSGEPPWRYTVNLPETDLPLEDFLASKCKKVAFEVDSF
jgi:hypothetical protein